MPWDQGVWEDEDGRLGTRHGEDYARDRGGVHEVLKLRIVWDGRGGRSVEAAIKRKYTQSVWGVQLPKYDSVEDRFARDCEFRDQMIAHGSRKETVGRTDKETNETLQPAQRSYEQRKKARGLLLSEHQSRPRGRTVRVGVQVLCLARHHLTLLEQVQQAVARVGEARLEEADLPGPEQEELVGLKLRLGQ